jgi:hypothetical protein
MSSFELIGLHDGDLSLLYVFDHLLLLALHRGAGNAGQFIQSGDSGASYVYLVLGTGHYLCGNIAETSQFKDHAGRASSNDTAASGWEYHDAGAAELGLGGMWNDHLGIQRNFYEMLLGFAGSLLNGERGVDAFAKSYAYAALPVSGHYGNAEIHASAS